MFEEKKPFCSLVENEEKNLRILPLVGIFFVGKNKTIITTTNKN